MNDTTTMGQWRLFTKREFESAFMNWKPSDSTIISNETLIRDIADKSNISALVYASPDSLPDAIQLLQYQTKALEFEHGKEGKIPRANNARPYRLTVHGHIVAVVVLSASEAYDLCEIKLFLTAECRGMKAFESTRAALVFAISDAVTSGGSMAVQFAPDIHGHGVPFNVRQLAERLGIHLTMADNGTITPKESRALYLRCVGLPKNAQERIETGSDAGHFSTERVCYLIASGLWSAREVAFLLRNAPYPEALLGQPVQAHDRLLRATASSFGRAAVLLGRFEQAVQYRPATRLDSEAISETGDLRAIPCTFKTAEMTAAFGPFPEEAALIDWNLAGTEPLIIPAGTSLLVAARPRQREELRTFLRQDIEAMQYATIQTPGAKAVLVYPADIKQLPQHERREIDWYAKRNGLAIAACPMPVPALEAELTRRLRVGRRIRA